METNDLLRFAIQVFGRMAIPVAEVRAIVGSASKQIHAYSLCDGTRTQTEIGRVARLDQGNLSRTLRRWSAHGVVMTLGEGKDTRYLHIYPLPPEDKRKKERA